MSSDAAIRQARYRDRRHRGVRVLRGGLELDTATVRALVAAGVMPQPADDAELLRYLSGLLDFIAEPPVSAAIREQMEVYVGVIA